MTRIVRSRRLLAPRRAWGHGQLRKIHRLSPRVGEAHEVAMIISGLASAERPTFNGAVITADGGWLS